MTDTPLPVLLLALVILVQLVLMDYTEYYNAALNIMTRKIKPSNLDILFFIVLFPSTLFLYIDRKISETRNKKVIQSDKVCRWQKNKKIKNS